MTTLCSVNKVANLSWRQQVFDLYLILCFVNFFIDFNPYYILDDYRYYFYLLMFRVGSSRILTIHFWFRNFSFVCIINSGTNRHVITSRKLPPQIRGWSDPGGSLLRDGWYNERKKSCRRVFIFFLLTFLLEIQKWNGLVDSTCKQ